MPPKKKLKPDKDQRSLLSLFGRNGSINEDDNEVNKETLTTENANDSPCEQAQSQCKKDQRKFQDKWLKLWPWLRYNEGKMICFDCVKCGKNNSFTTGCETFKTSSMVRHEATVDHQDSIKAPQLQVEMETAIEKTQLEEDEAMIKALKIVYWMASENLPLSKYSSLMNLVKILGIPGLQCLVIGSRIDYESYYSANELLEAISDAIDGEINEKLSASPCITVFADESTDIANSKRMTITARYVNPETSEPFSVFLRDSEYDDGSGSGLTSEILNELKSRNIPLDKVTGFGSDGASVMSGSDKGVKGRLKQHNPHMVHIHCMAHRLALCTSQAADSIPAIKKYQEWLTQLFYYFKASATKEGELHKMQAVLESPKLKYKEIHAVRWLSFYEALEAVYRTLDALITYFDSRQPSKDPKAKGLVNKLATTEFFYITYMMMDVIPLVSKLCLAFQAEDLDVAKAKISLDLCLADLEAYLTEKQIFKTHIETFDNDVKKVGEHYEYKGHRLKASNLNFSSLKSQFVNKLISNIKSRFPQKTLLDAFYILSMRTINFQQNLDDYGNDEIEVLLNHYGEEQTHKLSTAPPMMSKDKVRAQWQAAKQLVRAGKYPTDRMTDLWVLLTKHHKQEIPDLIKLAQIALTLPLHTAGCERVFSQQNLIVTKQRSRLSPVYSDRLIRVRVEGKGLEQHNFEDSLKRWHQKKRIIKTRVL